MFYSSFLSRCLFKPSPSYTCACHGWLGIFLFFVRFELETMPFPTFFHLFLWLFQTSFIFTFIVWIYKLEWHTPSVHPDLFSYLMCVAIIPSLSCLSFFPMSLLLNSWIAFFTALKTIPYGFIVLRWSVLTEIIIIVISSSSQPVET